MDELVRENISSKNEIYSEVEIRKVPAYVLPEDFQTNCPGVEYAQSAEAEYAVITVTEPMIRPFERIPTGYKCIMEYLQTNNFKDKISDDIISCFEHEYEKDACNTWIFMCMLSA